MDCRKNVNYNNHHEGKYIERLTKTDVKTAAMIASILISNGLLKELIEKRLTHKIHLDYISQLTKESLKLNTEKNDVVYDFNTFDNRFLNLHDNLQAIVDTNKKSDLTVCLGSKTTPYYVEKIPPNNFKNINDILSNFSKIMENLPYSFNYYVVNLVNEDNRCYVELLPETGSA